MASNTLDGAHHAGFGLQRQAIDQINADRLEATGAGGIDHQPGFFLALDAVDRLLHFRLKILHPTDMRLKPSSANRRTVSAVTLRGSISIENSPPVTR